MMIEIAPFTIELYDEVLAMWRQCEGIGLSSADSRENIKGYLDRNPGMSFVATDRGRIVGAILAGHDGRRGYIHHLAVRSGCRRRGIGRTLADRCLTVLAESGIVKCHIFIFNNNIDGIAFWKSAGWTPRSDIQVISKTIEPCAGGKS